MAPTPVPVTSPRLVRAAVAVGAAQICIGLMVGLAIGEPVDLVNLFIVFLPLSIAAGVSGILESTRPSNRCCVICCLALNLSAFGLSVILFGLQAISIRQTASYQGWLFIKYAILLCLEFPLALAQYILLTRLSPFLNRLAAADAAARQPLLQDLRQQVQQQQLLQHLQELLQQQQPANDAAVPAAPRSSGRPPHRGREQPPAYSAVSRPAPPPYESASME